MARVSGPACVDDVRIVAPHHKTLAFGQAGTDSDAANRLAFGLAGLGAVSPEPTPVRKCHQPRLHVLPAELRTEIRRINLCVELIAAVVRELAHEKAAHAVRAANAELLACDQRIGRVLAEQLNLRLPVIAERARVMSAIADYPITGARVGTR